MVACQLDSTGNGGQHRWADGYAMDEAVMLGIDRAFDHHLRVHRHTGEVLLLVGAHGAEVVDIDWRR